MPITIAPWWATPLEHIITVLITITVPSIVTILWGNKKRNESHIEHILTKLKLDALASNAKRVGTNQAETAQQLSDAIAKNTSLTNDGITASKEAVEVANNTNNKIIEVKDEIVATLKAVKVQQEQEHDRQDLKK